MPELPEVETIRRQLKEKLPLKIDANELSKGLFQNILKTKINLADKTILDIERIGKILIFKLSDGSSFLSHLGMTGTWLIGNEQKVGKHSHLILKDSQKSIWLIYDDPRRFGKIYYYESQEKIKQLIALGPDLLSEKLDLDFFKAVIKKFPNKPIKVLLLDQKYFAGSGNYIANEICARAKVRPQRKCKSLTATEIKNLHKSIRKVIEPALGAGGTTFQGGYRDATGEKGQGKDHLVVFYKKICQMCKVSKVKKMFLAQRGTYYCPTCQK